MSLKEKNYKPRLIDDKIDHYLKVFGALSIEGPKWCGKTWTSLAHANSIIDLTDPNLERMAKAEPENILFEERPELIDEWQIVPSIWDAVRHECDRGQDSGKFILTGSTTLRYEKRMKEVHHSGAGRFVRMHMHTMSLYETGDSSGQVSIMDMYKGKKISGNAGKVTFRTLANFIIRGGWPRNLKANVKDYKLLPKAYIDNILTIEIDDDDRRRDKDKMSKLLMSLSRNESTVVSNKTLMKDIESPENDEDLIMSRNTLNDYLDLLERLHLFENQKPYSSNYRSPERIGKAVKRHMCDPSLAAACLNLTQDMLIKDLNTFGFLFEALVVHDLQVYMDYLDGKVYYFRDNISGLEADAVLEFEDGEYALVEVKLSYDEVDVGLKSLQNLYDKMIKKPKFMAVIIGTVPGAYKDPDTGIYVVPITVLKP